MNSIVPCVPFWLLHWSILAANVRRLHSVSLHSRSTCLATTARLPAMPRHSHHRMRSNPSIEGTCNIWLRQLSPAPHVKRYPSEPHPELACTSQSITKNQTSTYCI